MFESKVLNMTAPLGTPVWFGLGSHSKPFSEISEPQRHIAPTCCPAESPVPVFLIALGRTREMRSRCPLSDWVQSPAIKKKALPHIGQSITANQFFYCSLSQLNGKRMSMGFTHHCLVQAQHKLLVEASLRREEPVGSKNRGYCTWASGVSCLFTWTMCWEQRGTKLTGPVQQWQGKQWHPAESVAIS